jgi:hypothetical protein
MNARSLVLIGAVAILGIGAIMMLSSMFGGQAPPNTTQVAVALQLIEPYTIITQEMIGASEDVYERDAEEKGGWPVTFAVGKMSTDRISPGVWITADNAKPVEDVRFTQDLGLEVLSIQAALDRSVGGKLRPGHMVNLYGNGRTKQGDPFTRLIESQVWVVAVSASGQAVSNATPVVNLETGELTTTGGEEDRSASVITIAVRPDQALNIVNAIGAENLAPYVTLAASQTAASALATPVPEATASPTFGLPDWIKLTATALASQIALTPPPRGPVTGGGGTK